jgi:hypothetical protein
MLELTVYGHQVSNFFELLGEYENALTLAVGWTLCQSPHLLGELLNEVFDRKVDARQTIIRLQGYQRNHGYTDIEIDVSNAGCAIIEAKRGWVLPSRRQLVKYASRETFRSAKEKRLVVLNESVSEYVDHNLKVPKALRPLVKPIQWQWLIANGDRLANQVGNTEKGVLRQMSEYLKDHTTARDPHSNQVYVVSLSNKLMPGCKITWIDVVEKKHRYFHPVGPPGWPPNPPTYIGFRYAGKLQSIHYVQSYSIVDSLDRDIPEIKWGTLGRPHFIYVLGKPIKPTHEVRTGQIFRSGRVTCALDLLLTSKTISQAGKLTRKRDSS